MINYIISAIIIYFFLGFLLFFFQRRIIFNVSGKPNQPIDYGLPEIQVVNIVTSDKISLISWYSKPKLDKPTLLYLHGNSFDIGERAYRIERYIKNGWGVLLLSWRGFSGNKGNPTEKNLYEDASSALNWLKNKKNTDFKNIVIYGESLGSAVAVQLSTQNNFKSVILEAPFTSIYDIALKRYKIYPFKFLILDKFDNYKKINQIKSPILIVSGKNDEVVPHKHSIKLFNAANYPKDFLFIDEAMHNNLYDFGIEKIVINFSLNIWK
tara:strand:- start:574 stop:1374 length:801 start_codon:yes stop_codon:yes gene_type:complete